MGIWRKSDAPFFDLNQVNQLTSKIMNTVAQQAELPLARRAKAMQVPVEMIRSRKNKGAAFTLACDASSLDDKEIYVALDIDAGTFSRIKKGTNTLDADLIDAFCDVVGNDIYLEWMAFQRGYALVMIKSEAERRAEEAERQLAEERLKYEVLLEAFTRKVSG